MLSVIALCHIMCAGMDTYMYNMKWVNILLDTL